MPNLNLNLKTKIEFNKIIQEALRKKGIEPTEREINKYKKDTLKIDPNDPNDPILNALLHAVLDHKLTHENIETWTKEEHEKTKKHFAAEFIATNHRPDFSQNLKRKEEKEEEEEEEEFEDYKKEMQKADKFAEELSKNLTGKPEEKPELSDEQKAEENKNREENLAALGAVIETGAEVADKTTDEIGNTLENAKETTEKILEKPVNNILSTLKENKDQPKEKTTLVDPEKKELPRYLNPFSTKPKTPGTP